MDIITCQAQILRVEAEYPYPELSEALQEKLKCEVLGVTQRGLEAALCEKLQEHLNHLARERPRRSGYFKRVLDSAYGRIDSLLVPKLREGNRDRDWQILQRYQRGLGSLFNLIPRSLCDGVVHYPSEATFEDQAGHLGTLRQAQERVVLVAMAIYPDGTREILHYEITERESQAAWASFFQVLQERRLNLDRVELVVSLRLMPMTSSYSVTRPTMNIANLWRKTRDTNGFQLLKSEGSHRIWRQ